MLFSGMRVAVLAFLLHLAYHADAETEYHGKLVGSFGSTIHNVQGTVYAEDDSTLRIIGFSYDGTAPDAFLWGGETGSPSTNGFIIPDETGSMVKLGPYSNVDITVTLPSGKSVSNLAWISVWCRQFAANFGQVIFQSPFVPPSHYNIGPLGFSPLVHGTSASAVVVLDPKRIRFENLYYDGFGPDAYFWVGEGGTPSYDKDYRIPDENGSLQKLSRYSGETVTVTLIDNITVSDIGHIGLWCVLARQDFGHVDIPAIDVLNIPPLPLPPPATTTASTTTIASTTPTQTTTSTRFSNCETLVEDELQVSWYIDGTDIVIRLSSTNEVGMYSAFGVSGSPTSTQMMGGDVVVTFIDNGVAQAVDYYLDAQAQCSPQNGAGACPDVIASDSAYNDVTLVESSNENGVTHIVYRRPLAARDSTYDKAISTTGPTYVIWARGFINADGRVAYHSQQRSPATSNLQINFGQASSTCPPLSDNAATPSNSSVTTPSQEEEGWTIEGIVETEDATFTVDMGLTGGQKGYNYITGSVGWGIAWFINGLLIPELTLTRGKTYTFLVSGGDDPTFSANYHPFYITDDPSGGYAQLSQAEKEDITIYSGPEEGPLCQWAITSGTANPDSYASFADYKTTLTRDCQPGEPGELVWTVPMDAPDLLYYHCFTHRFLGWKIHLVDGDENMTSPTTNKGTTRTITTTMNPAVTTEVAYEYHGKLVGSFGSTIHNVEGTVYAEDDSTLRIIGFSYDGTEPDAFLWGGETGSPSRNGFIIPDENGSVDKLGFYSNMDITVTLPSGKTVSNLAWISVWCRQFAANFGQVVFPSAFVPPSPYHIGRLGFSPSVHGTSATGVVVLDPKRIRFENLHYDGRGPDAYFWVGPGDTPSYDRDYRIPDERGSFQRLDRYSGETVTVTLIDNITVSDIGHIGLWCVLARQDFGHVDIPALDVLNIPPLPLPTPATTTASMTTTTNTTPTQTTTAPRFSNCETLVEDELQVSWYIDGTNIVIRLSSTNEVGMYSAFGVSGSPTSTQMLGGDVVVTFISDNGVAQAVDYYLDAQAQCSPQNGAGSCPDVISSGSAENDVTLVESSRENGVTHIVYQRPLAARDATYDKAISTTGPTYVIWARGLINADGRVAYHLTQRLPANSNLQINFGRASSTCPPLGDTVATPSQEAGWTIEGIVETDDATFTVDMGLTGGQKGYDYITGSVGWGIAWFINGLLIPELTLTRGKTYTFLVSGGDDPTSSGNYHPFYITDDPSGGYAQLSQAEQQNATIYAGPEEGPLCQWEITSNSRNPDSYSSFADFKATLIRDCQPGEPGELVWTVPMDAPDLLYYHCYTHRFLGWKIHLVDIDENMTSQKPTMYEGITTLTRRTTTKPAVTSGGLTTDAGTFIAVVVSCFLVLALVLSLGCCRQIKQKPKSTYTVTLLSDLRKNEVTDKFSKE